MSNPAPLIFIHYGDSRYLTHTLHTARVVNPGAPVILLGDAANRHRVPPGVEWIDFAALPHSDAHREFARLFTPILGARHGKEAWVRFVFERWFFVETFIRLRGYDRFWTFDSDTVLLRQLAALEPELSGYDTTEQCNGMCMNGFVAHAAVVRGYLDSINEQFTRPEHLDAWRRYVGEHPDFAFTEMGAYLTYKKEAALRTRHLLQPLSDGVFDDAICQDHGFEMTDPAEAGVALKRVLADADGRLYVRRRDTTALVRLLSINMSWAPEYLYRRWTRFAARSAPLGAAAPGFTVTPVDVRRTSGDRLRELWQRRFA